MMITSGIVKPLQHPETSLLESVFYAPIQTAWIKIEVMIMTSKNKGRSVFSGRSGIEA